MVAWQALQGTELPRTLQETDMARIPRLSVPTLLCALALAQGCAQAVTTAGLPSPAKDASSDGAGLADGHKEDVAGDSGAAETKGAADAGGNPLGSAVQIHPKPSSDP